MGGPRVGGGSRIRRNTVAAAVLTLGLASLATGSRGTTTTGTSGLPCVVVAGVNDRCPTWTSTEDGPGVDAPNAIAMEPGGKRLFLAGYRAEGSGPVAPVTLALDPATGQELWQAPNPDVAPSFNAYAMAVGQAVYTVGGACGDVLDGGTCDVGTVAYSTTDGRLLWSVRHDEMGGLDAGFDIAAGPGPLGASERAYVAGRSFGDATDSDVLTIAYDGVTGERLWSRTFDSGKGFADVGAGISVDPTGERLYVTGRTSGSGTEPSIITTLAYDARTGERLWVADHPTTASQDFPMIELRGGRLFVVGISAPPAVGMPLPNYLTLALDPATGRELWAAEYDGPIASADTPWSLVTSPDGARVYVTGMSRSDAGYDYATVSYDAGTGAKNWEARFDGPSRNGDAAWTATLSPDAKTLYVGGSSFLQGPGYLNVVVAFDAADGARRWVGMQPGPGPRNAAVPSALLADPGGGHVYLLAQSGDATGLNPSLLTAAYPTGP